MCGIAGILSLSGAELPDAAGLVGRMMRTIVHRGPDDEGVWIASDHKLAFGHRRLSILDLSPNGRQPMFGERGAVIVYNGELYNFRELKTRFEGSVFRSTSDTEVLL